MRTPSQSTAHGARQITRLIAAVALLTVAGCSNSKQPFRPMEPFEGTYVITAHTVVTAKDGSQEDDYTVVYGADVLKVKYASSQTSSAKPGDFPGTGLHPHYSYSHPDLTQVPQVSVPIRTCLMDKDRDKDGDLIIAKQPTPEPCMARVGDTLQYEPEPNGPVIFTHVAFDIISERAR